MTAEQIGYLIGILISPLLYMLIIGTIYYLIKQRRIPFRQAVLNRWVIASSLILFLLGLIGRSTSNLQQESSHIYPDSSVKAFTESCVDSAKAKLTITVAEKVCSCSIVEIQKVYTYGEFKKVDEDIRKNNTALPSDVTKILFSCAQKQT
jgi:hypothetical protein